MLCVSLIDSGMEILWAPASIAASHPLRLGTSTAIVKSGYFCAPLHTSAVSAICGNTLGDTKEPTSISRTPHWYSHSIHFSLSAVGIIVDMLWSPSLGPTSLITTFAFGLMKLLRCFPLLPLLCPEFDLASFCKTPRAPSRV